MQVELDFEPVVVAVAAAAVLAAVLVERAAVAAVATMEKVIEGFVCTAAIAAAAVIAAAVIAFAAVEIFDMLNLVLVPAAAVAFHCVFETMMICPY